MVGEEFIDRREILRTLSNLYENDQNAALVGVRRIGKSSIAREFCRRLKEEKEDVVPVYFEVHKNMGTPGRFAVRFLIEALAEYFKHMHALTEDISNLELDIRPLLELARKIKSEKLMELAQFLISYYSAGPTNERQVFKKVFEFFEEFAIEQRVKFAMILDEFQDIRMLERYKAFGKEGVLSLFEGISSGQRMVWYCLTGSLVRMMEEILEDAKSPLYGRFRKIKVECFEEEDTRVLATKICQKPLTGEALRLLHAVTEGNPYYIVVISNGVQFLAEDKQKRMIDKELVEESIYSEIIDGELNSHCNYLFESSLARASRSTSLKEVMKYIALRDGATPSEIAKDLGREMGEISPLLRNLQNVDLIRKHNKRYSVIDPVLAIWLKAVYGFSEPRLEKIKRGVEKNYMELVTKLKRERGFLFESYVRELFRRFDGAVYEERELPEFERVDSVNIYDKTGIVFDRPSNVEINALCQGKANWIVEFEYRDRLVTEKDLRILKKRRKLVEEEMGVYIDQVCFVSVAGFREEALRFAKESNVWCMDLKVLNALLRQYGMHRVDEI